MGRQAILITGSSGQSGTAIAGMLSMDYDIIGLDIRKGKFTTLIGSLTDWRTVKEASKNVAAIIHTAALHAPHIPTHSKEEFIDTNIKGTLYLLEAARQYNIQKFVFTSSTSLYGRSMELADQAAWITEDVYPISRNIYDITKLAAEDLCRDFFDKNGLRTLSLRVSRFWDEPLERKVFYRMYRGVDVRDVAHAHKLALTIDFDQFENFNISAQSIFEKPDLIEIRKNLHGLLARRFPAVIEFYKRRSWVLPDFIDRVYVIEKAKRLLGYRPVYNIDRLMADIG